MIDAFNIAAPQLPEYRLVIIGDGAIKFEVERKIAQFYQDQKKQKWRERAEPVVEFDRRYLKGNLKKLKNFVFDQKKVK